MLPEISKHFLRTSLAVYGLSKDFLYSVHQTSYHKVFNCRAHISYFINSETKIIRKKITLLFMM